MKSKQAMLAAVVLVLGSFSQAQSGRLAQDGSDIAVNSPGDTMPRIVKYSGTLRNDDGSPMAGAANVTFTVYASREATSPLWSETQAVTPDAAGKYNVLLGSRNSAGIPQELFANGDARWLGVQVEGRAETERTVMVSVPYSMKSGDSDSISGHAFTDFIMTRQAIETLRQTNPDLANSASASASAFGAVTSGTNTVNSLAKFTATDTVGNSAVFENGGKVGINNTTPTADLDVVGATPSTTMRIRNSTNGINFGLEGPAVVERDIATADAFWFALFPTSNGTISAQMFGGSSVNLPGSKLLINGDLQTTGAATIGGFANLGGASIKQGNNGLNYSVEGGTMVMRDPSVADAWWMALKPTTSGLSQIDVFGGSVVTRGFMNMNGNLVANQSANSGGVVYSASSPPPAAVRGDAKSGVNWTAGVLGTATSPDGAGVAGQNVAGSGNAVGVFGFSPISNIGVGVWGEALGSGQNAGVFGRTTSPIGNGVEGLADVGSGDAAGVYGVSKATGSTGVYGEVLASSGVNFGVYGRIVSPQGGAGVFDSVGTGNILIGRTGSGGTNVFRVDSTGKMFANGGSQLSGADFAESVNVREEKFHYQPGDVIAIDTENTRTFTLAKKAYSTLVAGIYSTKPGVLATPHTADDARIASEEIPLAVVGIVPCKVSNENGEVKPGDLLVSSSTPGYAMKGTDRNRMTGAVIGKALQPMTGRSGVIEVLVSLQ